MYSGTVLNPQQPTDEEVAKATRQLELIVAVKEKDLAKINALLDDGAEINHCDRSGDAPLHYAVKAEDATTTRHLIAHGADINLQGANNSTPLHICADKENREIAMLLIRKGAKMTLRDEWGLTVPDRAAISQRRDMARFLREQPSIQQSNRVKRLKALRPRFA